MTNSDSRTAAVWLASRFGRLALVTATGLVAIAVTGASVDSNLIRTLVAAIFAPWGLAFLVSAYSSSGENMTILGVGWLVYLALALGVTFVRTRRAWVILYVIFVMLVLLNMAGCMAQCHTSSPNGNCFYFSIG